jgi:hypothetical protein
MSRHNDVEAERLLKMWVEVDDEVTSSERLKVSQQLFNLDIKVERADATLAACIARSAAHDREYKLLDAERLVEMRAKDEAEKDVKRCRRAIDLLDYDARRRAMVQRLRLLEQEVKAVRSRATTAKGAWQEANTRLMRKKRISLALCEQLVNMANAEKGGGGRGGGGGGGGLGAIGEEDDDDDGDDDGLGVGDVQSSHTIAPALAREAAMAAPGDEKKRRAMESRLMETQKGLSVLSVQTSKLESNEQSLSARMREYTEQQQRIRDELESLDATRAQLKSEAARLSASDALHTRRLKDLSEKAVQLRATKVQTAKKDVVQAANGLLRLKSRRERMVKRMDVLAPALTTPTETPSTSSSSLSPPLTSSSPLVTAATTLSSSSLANAPTRTGAPRSSSPISSPSSGSLRPQSPLPSSAPRGGVVGSGVAAVVDTRRYSVEEIDDAAAAFAAGAGMRRRPTIADRHRRAASRATSRASEPPSKRSSMFARAAGDGTGRRLSAVPLPLGSSLAGGRGMSKKESQTRYKPSKSVSELPPYLQRLHKTQHDESPLDAPAPEATAAATATTVVAAAQRMS